MEILRVYWTIIEHDGWPSGRPHVASWASRLVRWCGEEMSTGRVLAHDLHVFFQRPPGLVLPLRQYDECLGARRVLGYTVHVVLQELLSSFERWIHPDRPTRNVGLQEGFCRAEVELDLGISSFVVRTCI